jgi:hypothetical protein
LGLFSTSFYQIWVKVKQGIEHSPLPAASRLLTFVLCVRWVGSDQLGLNSYQLLYYQAPLSAVVVLLTVPLFDQVSGPGG